MSENHEKQKRSWLDRIAAFFTGEPQDKQDLIQVLRDAEDRELVSTEVLSMIEGVLQVAEMQVRDIMIPRAQMRIIPAHSPLEDILAIIIGSGHSRFPVTGATRDEVVGILHAKDILKYNAKDRPPRFEISDYVRPVSFVPESKRLDSLLKEFRRTHNHLAIVADEYGGIAGLVTIEDVLEQIVGDIEDEFDPDDESFIRQIKDNEYSINALTPIEDFNAHFHSSLSDEQFDTIGGLVLHAFGHMPKRGETTQIEKFHFKVLHADNRRVRLLHMSIESLIDS